MSETPALKLISVDAAKTMAQMHTADYAVYLPGSDQDAPMLYREQGVGVSAPDFDRLSEAGVSHILVRGEQLSTCERTLEDNLCRLMQDHKIQPSQKAACVQHVGTSLVRDLMKNTNTKEALARASNLLDLVIDGVLSDPGVASSLLQMSAHHQSTASHMFAVSTLGVLLGSEIFGPDQRCLRELGLAGMLHDLGKIKIDADILNKSEPLSQLEIRIIQHHPIESVRLVGDDPTVSREARLMILQHHERHDGRGYPLGLCGANQLPGSQVLCIVDSFHALIGRRRYREALSPVEANRLLGYQVGKQFAPAFFETWKSLFNRCWDIHAHELVPRLDDGDAGASYHEDDRPRRPEAQLRKSPRLYCQGRTVVRCISVGKLYNVHAGPDEVELSVYDLSRAGMCVNVLEPMYAGEVVHVLIRSHNEEAWVQGVIRWCRHQITGNCYKAGIQFNQRLTAAQAGQPAEVKSMADPEMFCRSTQPTDAKDTASAIDEKAPKLPA